MGQACRANNRLARGPKKGDLKALRSRIAALERHLSTDRRDQILTILAGDSQMPAAAAESNLPVAGSAGGPGSAGSASEEDSPLYGSPRQQQQVWDGIHVQVPPMTPTPIPLSFATFKFPPTPPSPPKRTFVDDLMRADLDQLYFDRVHPNMPIFNHSRYFARSRQNSCVDGPHYILCLQYAMWALAMALSSQFDSSRELLYNETRQMLEGLDLTEDDMHSLRIEQVQAWLLVAYYEFARSNYRRASISAGRAFRLVQLARLHEVDSAEEDGDPVLTEERRRTFWVAYCLDRLISVRNSCPLTLIEEVICTRLPSPELAFQGGHPLQGCFLPQAIASGDHNLLSPLAELAILVTISGRALSHCQVSSVERASGSSSLDFWLRHEWLDGMLARTLDSLAMNMPMVSAMTNPMISFAFMMGHATTIYMCQIVEGSGMDVQCRPTVAECRDRATHASREIASLAKAHEHIGYFKAHIFLPLAVSIGASRLTADRQRGTEVPHTAGNTFQSPGLEGEGDCRPRDEFQCCMDALRKIQSFNSLAREHLAVLETQEFAMCGL
ncbi:hypothetical protein BT67DRAFT_411328 [Trichocladium antarcticum]|uniref:Xylanolytic transcriptional activator regulatory domain-containing protein n=1 Tax=Trichocladium antarcticum TaxID=1450529 RepID=A0AAN6UC37_9PEZI|nr:hypothetical protein BT67DRAFT_411328 [Trichocladium antarcticum]